MKTRIRFALPWLAAAFVILLGAAPIPQAAGATQGEGASEAQQASEEKVQDEVDQKLAERRRAMLEEARVALDETHHALEALDQGESQEALEALARATGKLELLVAREPDLALAPVDVEFIAHDLYATPEAIRRARDRAEALLEEGEVQEARALLSGLASEFIISVTNLPLATYPDAIKAVSPLIDQGRAEEARSALRAALNTLVVTDQVISLPVLRARHMLDQAEALAKQEEASEADRKQISELVEGARDQLEMAELLGYGEQEEHARFRDQIAELERKLGADAQTQGVFAKLRRSLREFQSSFVE